ncbi:hypothetical protein Zm00014a_002241 [Zea mays]|uniref:Uncharacterized protein n=1 Tax=Zea mays TaxID=4577 RepID=A0A317YCA5_MAIZE|nr:hypothetical protein Zm00014a_002241 [Zea mays]
MAMIMSTTVAICSSNLVPWHMLSDMRCLAWVSTIYLIRHSPGKRIPKQPLFRLLVVIFRVISWWRNCSVLFQASGIGNLLFMSRTLSLSRFHLRMSYRGPLLLGVRMSVIKMCPWGQGCNLRNGMRRRKVFCYLRFGFGSLESGKN